MVDETLNFIMRGAVEQMAASLRRDADRRARATGEHYWQRFSPDELRRIAELLEWRPADK